MLFSVTNQAKIMYSFQGVFVFIFVLHWILKNMVSQMQSIILLTKI